MLLFITWYADLNASKRLATKVEQVVNKMNSRNLFIAIMLIIITILAVLLIISIGGYLSYIQEPQPHHHETYIHIFPETHVYGTDNVTFMYTPNIGRTLIVTYTVTEIESDNVHNIIETVERQEHELDPLNPLKIEVEPREIGHKYQVEMTVEDMNNNIIHRSTMSARIPDEQDNFISNP